MNAPSSRSVTLGAASTFGAVTIIRARHVLTMGPLGDVLDGAVAFDDGGTITAVGTFADVQAQFPDADVIGDEHGIVTPGFVCTHTHFSEAFTCGMGEDMGLVEWLNAVVLPVNPFWTVEMAEVAALLKGSELVRSGVTTINDMFVHSNWGSDASLGVVTGLEAVGMRGVISYGGLDMPGGVELDPSGGVTKAILTEWEHLAAACEASERQRFRLCAAHVHGFTDAAYDALVAWGRSEDTAVHIHLQEVREQVADMRMRAGVDPLVFAKEKGLLDLDVVAAHCIWLTKTDIDIMRAHDVKVSYNPVSNMILGSGVCPIPHLEAAGVTCSIGVDGAASNDSQNMLEAMKIGALLQKVHRGDPRSILATDVVRMATIDGARALSMEREVGSLEVGKRADVLRFDGHSWGAANVHDPYQSIVYQSSPMDIADVWCDGRRIVDNGTITTVDIAAVVDASKPIAADLVQRAAMGRHSILAQ
jgi:5-methylthioadenosine/S-adenosylhomocysteine deaminase